MQRGAASWRGAAIGLVLALASRGAEAHLVTTGLGPVYDGAAHFALSPEGHVPILGAALVAGGVLGGLPQAPTLVVPS